MNKILFLCTGNICRSSMAQGVAEKMIQDNGLETKFKVDSAGTHSYHVGEQPDGRAQRAAECRGYDLSHQSARRISLGDYEDFDLILAMDRGHLRIASKDVPRIHSDKIRMFTEYSSTYKNTDVPDPYYGGENGFEQVLDICEETISQILGIA